MKDLEQAKRDLASSVLCQLYCGDGSGKSPENHVAGCPNYECSFMKMGKKLEDSNKSDTES